MTSKTIRESEKVVAGKPTVAQRGKWINQRVPYKNFAAHDERLDRMVEQWVITHRTNYRTRMADQMERWGKNYMAANGDAYWLPYEDAVHLPEAKKALDNKVARVEEAILDFDPPFKMWGRRTDMPRQKAMMVQSFVRHQMSLAGFWRALQPTARDAELCNVMCVKVSWKHREDFEVVRETKVEVKPNGEVVKDTERSFRKVVIASHATTDIVDPFLLFYDVDATKAEDLEFIGDECDTFMHDADLNVRLGLFSKKAVESVRMRVKGSARAQNTTDQRSELTDIWRRNRSVANQWNGHAESRNQHSAKKVRTTECFGYFDFGEDGFDGVVDPMGAKLTGVHRVVATLLDDTVVRFSLNPFDKKFFPYAIEWINRNGHEMAAPANFTTVVAANAGYDRTHNMLLRQLDLSGNPIVVTRNDSDLPDSLMGIAAGSVLRATGEWNVVKVPDPVPQVSSYWHGFHRREMEETSGAMRIFESPQGTATESNYKVQEQQRLVRNSVRAVGELCRQVAQLVYWMSGQFMSAPEKFRVAGKAQSVIGEHAEMSPDLLNEDVEFEFVGINSLHTFGQRLAGMRQWGQNWLPILAQMPQVNLLAIAQRDYEMSVGMEGVEEIFPDTTPAWDTVTQAEENEMLLAGHMVPVSKADDDAEHIEMCLRTMSAHKPLPIPARKAFAQHLNDHMRQMQRKQAEQQAARQQAEQRAMLQQPAGGEPGRDRPPAEGGGLQATPAGEKGVTPGPTQERTVARTGRQGNGTSQSQRQNQ